MCSRGVRGGHGAALSQLCLASGARDWDNSEGGELAVVALGPSFYIIPGGAVEPCMGGVVTLAWDNVSCQESAEHSQNKMYLCQGE